MALRCISSFVHRSTCTDKLPTDSGRKSRPSASRPVAFDIANPEIPWTIILSLLDGIDIIRFALASHHFHSLAMEEIVWKLVCLRKLGVQEPERQPVFSWRKLYAILAVEVHAYTDRQTEKHIDWMRVGPFNIRSGRIMATDVLTPILAFSPDGDLPESGGSDEFCLPHAWEIDNVRPGIWIADLHLVRCPVCNLKSCEGTMQVLDARQWELFLMDGWKDKLWTYSVVGSHEIPFNCSQAAGGIFDATCLSSPETRKLFDTKGWVAAASDWQPRGSTSPNAAAACTNLQANEGLSVKCEVMQAGDGGAVVGVRISQQLV